MKFFYAAVMAVALAGPASAQGTAAKSDPCAADARRFCKDAVPDEAKIAACLKANQSKLSASCKKSYEARAKAKGM